MKKEVWISNVHIIPLRDGVLPKGYLGAYVNVLALASSKQGFIHTAKEELMEDFNILEFFNPEPFALRLDYTNIRPDIIALSRIVAKENNVQFDDFHCYRRLEGNPLIKHVNMQAAGSAVQDRAKKIRVNLDPYSEKMKKEIWIGRAHVEPQEKGVLLDGCPGAYVNVLVYACGKQDFIKTAKKELMKDGFNIIEFFDEEPFALRLKHGTVHPDIVALSEKIDDKNWRVLFDEFHAYEHEK